MQINITFVVSLNFIVYLCKNNKNPPFKGKNTINTYYER